MTSALFPGGKFAEGVLRELSEKVGKERLVVDIRWVPGVSYGTDRAAAGNESRVGSLP